MAKSAGKTDSYISMVLSLNGRVRPVDLQALTEDARGVALRTFFEAHSGEMELHFAGDDLVLGPEPEYAEPAEDSAPSAAPAEPVSAGSERQADLTESGESALDLLLGDYDGAGQGAGASYVAPALTASVTDAAGTTGFAAAGAAETPGPTPAGPSARVAADSSRTWLLWWIPTVLVPLLGGAAAWFALRRKRQTVARAMLTVGLALGVIASVLFFRYAEQIAVVTLRASTPEVIVLPSSPPGSGMSTSPPASTGSGSGSSSTGQNRF